MSILTLPNEVLSDILYFTIYTPTFKAPEAARLRGVCRLFRTLVIRHQYSRCMINLHAAHDEGDPLEAGYFVRFGRFENYTKKDGPKLWKGFETAKGRLEEYKRNADVVRHLTLKTQMRNSYDQQYDDYLRTVYEFPPQNIASENWFNVPPCPSVFINPLAASFPGVKSIKLSDRCDISMPPEELIAVLKGLSRLPSLQNLSMVLGIDNNAIFSEDPENLDLIRPRDYTQEQNQVYAPLKSLSIDVHICFTPSIQKSRESDDYYSSEEEEDEDDEDEEEGKRVPPPPRITGFWFLDAIPNILSPATLSTITSLTFTFVNSEHRQSYGYLGVPNAGINKIHLPNLRHVKISLDPDSRMIFQYYFVFDSAKLENIELSDHIITNSSTQHQAGNDQIVDYLASNFPHARTVTLDRVSILALQTSRLEQFDSSWTVYKHLLNWDIVQSLKLRMHQLKTLTLYTNCELTEIESCLGQTGVNRMVKNLVFVASGLKVWEPKWKVIMELL